MSTKIEYNGQEFRVWFKHRHVPGKVLKYFDPETKKILKGKGITECFVSKREFDSPIFKGISVCGKKDIFIKKLGAKIALGRALKKILVVKNDTEQT